MTWFAIIIFTLHALAEMAFGVRAFVTGAFSSQSADEAANQPAHLASSARFLGAALFSLGVLGAVVLIGPGVASTMGWLTAVIFCGFHTIGVAGGILTARQYEGFLSAPHARGALIVHGILALGFALVLMGPRA